MQDNIQAARHLVRQKATDTIDDLDQVVANTQGETSSHWQAFKTKLHANAEQMKGEIAQDRRDFSARHKEDYAQACECAH